MQSVVETRGYLKAAEAIFTEAEREKIVAMVAARSYKEPADSVR